MEQKKIRVTLPEYVYKAIAVDEEYLHMNRNKLCNMIFSIYSQRIEMLTESYKSDSNKLLQFNLTRDNYENYYDIFSSSNIHTEADFFRRIFYAYADQPKDVRELEILSKSVEIINEAINNRKKLKIKYKDMYRVIEPYFIISSEGETRNYVFCFCETNNDFRNYRLINFKPINAMKEGFERYDREYVEAIKVNFDPQLSYGKRVKVRLNAEGEEQLKKVFTNRPKVISVEEGVYEFECSEKRAQVYFPQFMGNAEIIEPLELREWFRKKYEEAGRLYNTV